ncbi:MAG: hypothetical protein ACI4KA_06270 [Oscillospiraceae bacterium]
MKNLYLVLTRSESVVSRLIHFATDDEYTHISLSFDKELKYLYSSGRKNGKTAFPAGPCRESFKNEFYSNGRIPCKVYELSVSDEVYDMARREVNEILSNADEYHYNIIGLLLCRMQISLKRKHHFFCSQFVSEVLSRSNAVILPKASSLMSPCDFMRLPGITCCFEGYIDELPVRNPVTA